MENIMKFLCEMVARDSLHQLEKNDRRRPLEDRSKSFL